MSAFIRLCFNRPVSVTAFYIFVVVVGTVAYFRLPVALLPDLRYPALAVWTAYPDVPPHRVERAVTERIEAAVAGTEGLLTINSRSQLGGSLVRLDFGWNADLDLALLDVREQIDRLGELLPDEAARPIVLRIDPSERPIMMIALRAGIRDGAISVSQVGQDFVALKQLAREVVARRLEQHPDVSRVRITGGHDRRIDVMLRPHRLEAHGVSIDDIHQALQAANVSLPGGTIRRGPFQFAVEVSGEFAGIEDVADAVIDRPAGVSLRLRDVAKVTESVAERRGLVEIDGGEALLVLVDRRPDANTVRAARDVREMLHQLEDELPGIRLDVVVDESVFIEQAIGGVAMAVLLGGMLAIIVLFVFLRRPRALVAVAVAVPLSLCITFGLFDLLGVSFNLISLSGLALGVGMLVDNAIVVVENIARLREDGMSPMEAARKGVAEVAGAVTASTLTTITVFLPISFVEGLAGRLFRDQSLAVATSLAASLLVALTVVPLVASTDRSTHPAATRRSWIRAYERALHWCLSHRAVVLSSCALLLIGAGYLVQRLPREVVPAADQRRLEVKMTLPPGADLGLVQERASMLTREWLGWAQHVLADLGERDEARLDLDPRPPYESDLVLLLPDGIRSDDAVRKIRATAVPADVELEVSQAQTQLEDLLTTEDADLLIDLVSEDRLDSDAAGARLLSRFRRLPELTNVRRAYERIVPAYSLTFRRDDMARFGVRARTIATYLEAAARGRKATELRTTNEEIPILLRTVGPGSIETLLKTRVPAQGEWLPLGTFVRAEAVRLPSAVMRAGQAPIVRIKADVAPGADLASATAVVETAFRDVLPAHVRGYVGGATDAFQASLRALTWSLLISVLLVYLILAAQFESLLQPLVVLSAIPLAAAGVTGVLWITGHTLNLMSLTGCVVLVGIVVNDAIVKVDFINQRRRAGLSRNAAILAAGRERVRPILMTTITTVLGLLPLALGFGSGAELRAPLAVAIVGGILSATLLTLFVVPLVYTLLSRPT